MENWPEDNLIQALGGQGAPKEQATHHLMSAYIHYVPTVMGKVNISKEEALDAFVDAILDLTEQVAKGKFRGESKLSSYLYKIFFYKSTDLFRKNSTNKLDYLEVMPEPSDPEPPADSKLEIREAESELHRFLDRMGEPCKQILLDWGFWGYSMAEIAARMGMENSAQAKDRKYRCLKELRKLMAPLA